MRETKKEWIDDFVNITIFLILSVNSIHTQN